MTESNELLPDDMQFVIEAIDVGTWRWNIKTGECRVNEKWAELIGYHIHDFSQKIENWELNTHPDDLAKAKKILKRHFIGELDSYECNFRMKHKDGHWVWLTSKGKVIEYDEDGSPLIMFGIHKDITKRIEAEIALKDSEERFRKLFDTTSGLAIQGYTPERKVIYWNKASERLYGYKREEALGKDMIDLIIPSDMKGQVIDAIENMNRTGEIIPASELCLRNRQDEPVDVFSSHTLITFENREPELFCIDMDMKEIKDERERAQAANKAKSEFLANMSHELRTPLNGVIGFSQILKDTDLNSTQKEYAEIIMNSATSLLELINDILDFSKIEAGKLRLQEELTNLKEVIDSVIRMITVKSSQKGLTFTAIVDETIPDYLIMDPVRFKQILINLLSNAVKFTEKGDIRLNIETIRQDSVSETIKLFFSITDTGIGIKEENIPKIMEPFNQEDYSATRRFGGTGLGLNITQNLLRKMGSTLQIESEAGKGSHFYFEIGFRIGNKPVREQKREPGTLDEKKIMIVEDNIINMKIAESLLYMLSSSIVIHKAFNGTEAIKKVHTDLPDIILMDLKMPGIDGYETTKIIRTIYPKLPIIAFTAMEMTEERNKCIKYGMNDYISKPFTAEKLKTTLQKYV